MNSRTYNSKTKYKGTGRIRSDGYNQKFKGRSTGAADNRRSYVYGTAAPAYAYENQKREYDRQMRLQRQRREKMRRRAARMNIFYLAVMTLVLCVLGMSFVWYVNLQFRITDSVEQIASCQKQLTQLRENNEESLNRIESSVNLDDIKYTAITELGMAYATKDQIVIYSNDSEDYVHQSREVGR